MINPTTGGFATVLGRWYLNFEDVWAYIQSGGEWHVVSSLIRDRVAAMAPGEKIYINYRDGRRLWHAEAQLKFQQRCAQLAVEDDVTPLRWIVEKNDALALESLGPPVIRAPPPW